MKFFGKGKQKTQPFIGFRHAHGIGIRSKYYVIPLSRGASGFTRAIAIDASLTLIENQTLASDLTALNEIARTFLPQLARHRHTAGIFIIAVGDESILAAEIAAEIQALGVACEYLVINQCPDVEIAMSIAMGTAQELKAMALSGLDRIDPAQLAITYRDKPAGIDDVVGLLEKNGFEIHLHQMSGVRRSELAVLALADVHAILSFVGADEYPSGALITPVINVAHDSDFHHSIAGQFDLGSKATIAEILHEVQQVFGMVPTFTETAGLYEPLFKENTPSLDDVDDAKEICLIPIHPVIVPFLIDLVSHRSGLFLRDAENAAPGKINAREILCIGTGSKDDELPKALDGDDRVVVLKISECGSLQDLVNGILARM
jgi:hypothetical protein